MRAGLALWTLAASARAFAQDVDGGVESARAGTVVTATRGPRPLLDVPADAVVIPRREIEQSPTQTVDELIRTVPWVSTFRRTSGLVSDPTAQGLSLRGIGPSGVSRSLMLVDGVPVNDGFGGWVYWLALPKLALDRIEAIPGASAGQYGNYALGGVVQAVSRAIENGEQADLELGAPFTGSGAVRFARRGERAGVELDAEGATTDGYPVVEARERGPIDQNAWSKRATVQARAFADPAPGLHFTAKGAFFDERENGGTTFTTAWVRLSSVSAGAQWDVPSGGSVEAALYGNVAQFQQERARLGAGRSSEALAAVQTVPSNDEGASVLLRGRPFFAWGSHAVLAGADGRRIEGTSDEALSPAQVTVRTLTERRAGGQQQFLGAFIQDAYAPNPVFEAIATLRYDAWQNLHSFRQSTLENGLTTTAAFADAAANAWSPSLTARARLAPGLAFRGALYQAFRAPTLNELYRPFQVGTVLTDPNEGLTAETLRGGEAGLELSTGSKLAFRATGFWTFLNAPVTNVTLATPAPDGAQRQRENLGQARVAGVELELDLRLGRPWSLVLSYARTDSQVTRAGNAPQLLGKQLAQDPIHRGNAALVFHDPRWLTARVALSVNGPQYEDDANTLPMGGYCVLDASLARRLMDPVDAFVAVQNALNRTYLVGRSGVDTIGAPLMARIGLRLGAMP